MATTEAYTGWRSGDCEGSPHCPPRCPRFVDKSGEALLVLPLGDDDDREALVRMYDDFAVEHRSMELPPVGESAIERWLGYLHDRGTNLVAWRGDRPVGHAGFVPLYDGDAEFFVFVHQAFHGRGIGSELTRQAIAYAAAADHDGIVLSVERYNRSAVAVYRRCGFVETGGGVRTLEMRLPLSDPIADEVRLAPGTA